MGRNLPARSSLFHLPGVIIRLSAKGLSYIWPSVVLKGYDSYCLVVFQRSRLNFYLAGASRTAARRIEFEIFYSACIKGYTDYIDEEWGKRLV